MILLPLCEFYVSFFAEYDIVFIHMPHLPFRGTIESVENPSPTGIVAERKNSAVDPPGIRLGEKQSRIFGKAQIAFKKVCRLENKASIDIDGIGRVHESEVAASAIVIEKPASMRMSRHPFRRIDRDPLVGDKGIISGKGTRPEPEHKSQDRNPRPFIEQINILQATFSTRYFM